MRIQHNITALNASNKLASNQGATSKNLEKLSSGYRINRAGDDAAGLAISEKMRGQIRGLDMAGKNAQDGISLIQTAEGGLNETHSILQRMRELAVQSSNGTYKNDVDRENIDKEIGALKSEVDRIASSTHYNGINLLDGSLGGAGSANGKGPKFGTVSTNGALSGAKITSDVAATINIATGSVVKEGGEYAEFSSDGTAVTLNLVANKVYSEAQINELIKNATTTGTGGKAHADINIELQGGQLKAENSTAATVLGVVATKKDVKVNGTTAGSAASITIEANQYGEINNSSITIAADAKAGSEFVEVLKDPDATANTPGSYKLHLSTGVEYKQEDIEKMLKAAGVDVNVKLSDDGFIKFNDSKAETGIVLAGGAGLGSGSSGAGALTFQIGANGSKDQQVQLKVGDMSTSGIGVSGVSLLNRESSNKAITTIDSAINKVSGTRADLGALQNRLEHTVSNLTTTSENLTAAESRIRDVDMAKEMMQFTKNNILSQAAQSMLAQANQQPQGVLQLLQ